MFLSFLYFLFVMSAMGWAAWRLLGADEEDGWSKAFMVFASGISIFVISSAVLGAVGASNWMAYLALSLVLLGAAVRKGGVKIGMPKISREWTVVWVLFLLHMAVYLSGAFSYPWLEDDDPWVHASAARYVSIYGTYFQPEHLPIHYLAPYPPFFDVLMGTLFQVDGSSLQGTLKLFNAILVSLSIPFFYAWTRGRFDKGAALWATFILAALPSFMSHFIWAQTLALMMAFPAFYFIDRFLKDGKRADAALGVLALATVLVSQPSVAGIIFVMATMYAAALKFDGLLAGGKAAVEAIKGAATIPALALVLAVVLFWGPMFALYGTETVLDQMNLYLGFLTSKTDDTSGGVVYSAFDFLLAPNMSKMDQPTGWGLVVSGLAVAGLAVALLRVKAGDGRGMHILLIAWFLFCMLGVEGNALPYKMMPHRFWVFLAIPVALLGGVGASWLLDAAGKGNSGYRAPIATLLVAGMIWTAAMPKAFVETSAWPPGAGWLSNEQIAGYIGLKQLPPNTKLFSFCGEEKYADGMDMAGFAWDKDVLDYKSRSINDSNDGNLAFLKRYGYEFVVIDHSCLARNEPEEVQAKLDALGADGRFAFMQQLSNQAFFVFRTG